MFSVISLKKGFAIVAAPLSIVGMAFMIGSSTQASADIVNTTGATVGTLPLCSWHLESSSTSVDLTHGNANKYDGQAYALSGTSPETHIYVTDQDTSGLTSAQIAALGNTNCSWFDATTNRRGASVSITAPASPSFSASPQGVSDSSDASMSFALTSDQKLTANPTPSATSTLWTAPSPGANDVYASHVSGGVTAIANTDVTTTSAYVFSVVYNVSVPANKTPKHPKSDYTYTGPALTTVLTLTA